MDEASTKWIDVVGQALLGRNDPQVSEVTAPPAGFHVLAPLSFRERGRSSDWPTSSRTPSGCDEGRHCKRTKPKRQRTHKGSAGCSQGKSPMSSVRAVAMIKAWPRHSPSTHRFVKRLTESGFTEKQAGTLAEEHVVLLNASADVPTASTEVRQKGR